MDEVVLDVLGQDWGARTLAMSGPSFAREIIQGMPTAVVIACENEPLATRICDIFFSDNACPKINQIIFSKTLIFWNRPCFLFLLFITFFYQLLIQLILGLFAL